jgi:type I restriction-modification system DNA methylase subunit
MKTQNEIKQEIRNLIDKYNKVVEEKRVSKYNEEMTKKDFILPLFRALGWNTEDSSEVTAEEKISKKRVDYGFRINGIPKFFLEAKSLREDLNNDEFIKQAINYAWLKGCTWAILTNFENVKIFNAEWKTSNPSQSHLKTISCQEFLDRFEELWLLSKESFEKGLLDKEAEKWGKKTKKTPVDKQLLADFTRFRELLSKNITKLNQSKNLTEEELDESVQRILDRLIFIRYCEDKGLEANTLISNKREWENKGKGQLIESLRKVFDNFDEQYNSKIFANHLCDRLDIDNEVLNKIIEGLYYTKDKSVSYDFSAIEADVLGNIYEQYLGHILKKSEKRAKLKKSHAHRKEQGIYYTPTYIVDYIVRNTLGELIKNKKPEEVEKIRVLDPACGSGSFLIKAFDVLNEYYAKYDKDYSQTQLDFNTGLSFTSKVKILKNNIFGVDLDKQAVDIAQLNLLLKIAEKGQRLPLLQENIKCGNSLIDDPAIAGDKAFKWEEEFKEVMQEGGFDVVVGNPPWGGVIDDILKYLENKYPNSTQEHKDTYKCFIEQGINLLKPEGILGFVVPNTCLFQPRYKDLRLFLKKYMLLKIVNLGEKVFGKVETPCCIIIVKKKETDQKNKVKTIDLSHSKDNNYKAHILSSPKYIELKQSIYNKTVDNNFVTFYRELKSDEKTLDKILDCRDAGINYQRVGTGMKEKGKSDLSDRLLYEADKPEKTSDKEYLKGEDIGRYFIRYKTGRFVRTNFKGFIKDNEVVRLDTKTYSVVPKILWRQTAEKPIATLDEKGAWFGRSIQAGILIDKNFDIKYILALLNSKYLSYIYVQSVKELGRVFPQVKLNKIKQLPIKIIPLEKQQPLINLVDKMLSLNKRLNEIGDKKTDERARIEEEIRKTDAEIDEFVYKIYGITDEEKKIIEESFK